MAKKKNPSWIEVYKRDGEWKIANGKTGKVLRTETTKADAMQRARGIVNHPNTREGYVYVGAQVYTADGRKDKRIVGEGSVKHWVRVKSRNH